MKVTVECSLDSEQIGALREVLEDFFNVDLNMALELNGVVFEDC